jgi:hypothetical protein
MYLHAYYKLSTSERRKQDKHTQTKPITINKTDKIISNTTICITFNAPLSYPSGRAV